MNEVREVKKLSKRQLNYIRNLGNLGARKAKKTGKSVSSRIRNKKGILYNLSFLVHPSRPLRQISLCSVNFCGLKGGRSMFAGGFILLVFV